MNYRIRTFLRSGPAAYLALALYILLFSAQIYNRGHLLTAEHFWTNSLLQSASHTHHGDQHSDHHKNRDTKLIDEFQDEEFPFPVEVVDVFFKQPIEAPVPDSHDQEEGNHHHPHSAWDHHVDAVCVSILEVTYDRTVLSVSCPYIPEQVQNPPRLIAHRWESRGPPVHS